MKIKVFSIIASILILIGGCLFIYKTYILKDTKSLDSIEVIDSRKIYFNIQDDIYYPVCIPTDLSFSTDNSKYIQGEDDCFNVSVVSGVDPYKFSESTLIRNAETLTKNIVITKNWQSADVMEAAIYITGDKAIRVSVKKELPEVFATIVKGFEKEKITESKFTDLKVTEYTSVTLPSFNGDPEVHAGLGESLSIAYNLGDGNSCLTISRELRKFEDAVKIYEQRIATIANNDSAECYYLTDNMFYAEVDDYVIGIYKVNYNTVLTCFGFGEEAKNNTVFFLTNQN